MAVGVCPRCRREVKLDSYGWLLPHKERPMGFECPNSGGKPEGAK